MSVEECVQATSDVAAVGADGKKRKEIGVFLLHGGQDDWRQMLPFAATLSAKFGYKVLTGTFPGRLYLPDPSRWCGHFSSVNTP